MNDIQTRIDYSNGEVFAEIVDEKHDMSWNGYGHLFHRQDIDEDGRVTHTYGIELTEKKYRTIAGMVRGDIIG